MHGRSRFPVKIGKQWEHIDVGSNHPLGQQADTERYQQQEKESRSERSLANGHNKLRLGACRAGDYGGSDKTRVGSTSSLQWIRNPKKPIRSAFLHGNFIACFNQRKRTVDGQTACPYPC